MNYPPPGTSKNNARIREIATKSIKRFGPLLVTGLAAVVEHHWLKHNDLPESNDQVRANDIRDDKSSIQELREQVAKLRRMIKRKAKEKGESTSDSSSAASGQREFRRDPYERGVSFQENQTYEPLFRELVFESQASKTQYPKSYQNMNTAWEREPSCETQTHKHQHHHRHSFPHEDFSSEAIYAGKVAALAGAVEALYVGDVRGDWIGPKGVRVGTSMAASFASTYARDRDPENIRTREVLADVGTGLVVSRLVHGSKRRIEEDNERQSGRRWSYWY